MPMIPFVPDTLILSGQVNANFQNAVSVDTPRNITVSHNWTARQDFSMGIAVRGSGEAQPPMTFIDEPTLGFYRKANGLIGVAGGRLDIPGISPIAAGDGITISSSNGDTLVSARPSTDLGNILGFGADQGLFATAGITKFFVHPGGGAPITVDDWYALISIGADILADFPLDVVQQVSPGAFLIIAQRGGATPARVRPKDGLRLRVFVDGVGQVVTDPGNPDSVLRINTGSSVLLYRTDDETELQGISSGGASVVTL